jgi:hypothetical protein
MSESSATAPTYHNLKNVSCHNRHYHFRIAARSAGIACWIRTTPSGSTPHFYANAVNTCRNNPLLRSSGIFKYLTSISGRSTGENYYLI